MCGKWWRLHGWVKTGQMVGIANLRVEYVCHRCGERKWVEVAP